MSRIVHGPSADVKGIRVLPRTKDPIAFSAGRFQSFGLQGALTDEEMKSGLANARAEGYREAEERMGAPLKAGLENIERILDELSQFRRELFKESEKDVLDLIQSISKRVVMKELSIDPALMKTVVEKALSLLEKQRRITLQINSGDFEFYERARPDFLAKFKGLEEFEISVTSDIPKGSVLAKSKSVELDVRLEAMVDHLLSQVQSAKIQVNQTNDEGDNV